MPKDALEEKKSRKERLYDFIEENFRQIQSAQASQGWRYLYLAHPDTAGRVVAQIRDNEHGQFGFELFVPATHSRKIDKTLEATLNRLEEIADRRRKELSDLKDPTDEPSQDE